MLNLPELASAIQYSLPNAVPLVDYRVEASRVPDTNDFDYVITEWNLASPQPTEAQVRALVATPEFIAWNSTDAVKKRKQGLRLKNELRLRAIITAVAKRLGIAPMTLFNEVKQEFGDLV